jgi:ketosteroid isomerase-like protein
MKQVQDDAVAIAHRFFDALGRGDRDAVLSLVSENAIVWQSYDDREKPFSARIDNLMRASQVATGFGYVDRRYTSLCDGALMQHRLRGRVVDGTAFDAPIAVRIYTCEGRIIRFEEYIDRGTLAPLYEAMRAGAAE